MSRPLRAMIESVTGTPREGLRVDFVDGAAVSAITAADGVFVADLETATPYTLCIDGALQIDGVAYPAGTVFLITVPEGEGPATFAECLTGTIDASPSVLLAALGALTARVAALEGP